MHKTLQTLHERLQQAVRPRRGDELTRGQIISICLQAFPATPSKSICPDHHAESHRPEGNKGCCECVGTERQIFDRVRRGRYRVR